MVSQITSLMIVYTTVYSGADQRKHQISASLAFVRDTHRWPMNSPHKGSVTRKMFPFDDVILHSNLHVTKSLRAFPLDGVVYGLRHGEHCVDRARQKGSSPRLHYLEKITLQWRHNENHGVSNHRRLRCLLNCWFRHRSKKTPKLRVTGLC